MLYVYICFGSAEVLTLERLPVQQRRLRQSVGTSYYCNYYYYYAYYNDIYIYIYILLCQFSSGAFAGSRLSCYTIIYYSIPY